MGQGTYKIYDLGRGAAVTPTTFKGLLFSEDQEVLSTMSRALESSAIDTEVALSLADVSLMLEQHTFDAIFVDFKDAEVASHVLYSIRGSIIHREAIVMSINGDSGSLSQAFGLGVKLSMPRPKTVDSAVRCLRSCCAFLAQQRQKALPQDVPVAAGGKSEQAYKVSA